MPHGCVDHLVYGNLPFTIGKVKFPLKLQLTPPLPVITLCDKCNNVYIQGKEVPLTINAQYATLPYTPLITSPNIIKL